MGSFSLTSTWFLAPRIYQPLYEIYLTFEASLICEIKYHDDTVCLFEIVFGQWKKFLLTSCVPDTDCDFVIVDDDNFFFQSESQSRRVILIEWGWVMRGLLYPSMNLRMRLVLPELGFPITMRSIFTFATCSDYYVIIYNPLSSSKLS